uniref:NudC domain-containing protein 1 n=1 Tax=Timema bartmani TaxID=61472 RepID=A0A7R9I7S3_9NEOP|nr:unnamed protein product [Timema bartmani]
MSNDTPFFNDQRVDHVLPSDDQYSFLHVKAFGLHNHLSADPWSTEYIYFIDKKWKIQRYIHSQTPSRVEELREVWELPSHHERRPGHYNPSMSFSSPELVVLTDGAGTLHLVNTGPRAGTAAWEPVHTLQKCHTDGAHLVLNTTTRVGCQLWRVETATPVKGSVPSRYQQVLFSEEVCGKETPFTILHSRTVDHEEVHCLLLHIDDRSAAGDSKETGPVFLNMVEWVTLVQGDSSTWSVRSVRRLCGPGNLDYTALEDTCSSVYIASDKPFHYTMDSENTIIEDKTEPLPITDASKPEYIWQQTSEDVTVWFQLPAMSIKSDINIVSDPNTLEVQWHDSILLGGSTCHRVDSTLTTWTLDAGKEGNPRQEEAGRVLGIASRGATCLGKCYE